jgi:hypothetical protein
MLQIRTCDFKLVYIIFRRDRLLGGYFIFLSLSQFMAIVLISPKGVRSFKKDEFIVEHIDLT